MRTKLGKVLVVLVALAACSDDGGDEAAATTTTSGATTTTESEATTTTAVPFDIEVRRAAIDLLEIRNDVFMHPDVSRVSEYIADTCVCLERERGFIEGFVAQGARWTVGPVEVRAVQLTVDDPEEPSLTLIVREPEADLVRADGSVVEHANELPTASYRVSLLRVTGAWLINGLTSVQLNDRVVSEVLAVGLP